jgi:hypothetical protein
MVAAVARKIEFFIKDNPGINLKLTRLALNEEHINKFKLPKAPKHGEEVVELDALEAIHPGEMGKIVEQALEPYYDKEKVKIVKEENNRMYDFASTLIKGQLEEPLKKVFDNINISDIAGDLDLSCVINSEFEVPEPGKEVKETRDWVYDSSLSYFEQLEAYKKYKSDRQEEVPE